MDSYRGHNSVIDYLALGACIQGRRQATCMTQEQLAEKVNLSPAYISHVERGTKKVSLEALARISAALEVTVDQLLTGSQPFDNSAYMRDMKELLGSCSLVERRIILTVAVAARDALIGSGLVA